MNGLRGICAGALAGGVLLLAQTIPQPRKQFGASITGAFEGWFNSEKVKGVRPPRVTVWLVA